MTRFFVGLSTFVIVTCFFGLAFSIVTGDPYLIRDWIQKPNLEISAKAEAVPGLVAAAENGDPDAQLMMARYAFLGEGMEADDAAGAAWIQQASQNGSARAKGLLGMLHLGGIGVEQNFDRARQLLLESNDKTGLELAVRLEILENALAKLPPEEHARQKRANYAAASRDIKIALIAMLKDYKPIGIALPLK